VAGFDCREIIRFEGAIHCITISVYSDPLKVYLDLARMSGTDPLRFLVESISGVKSAYALYSGPGSSVRTPLAACAGGYTFSLPQGCNAGECTFVFEDFNGRTRALDPLQRPDN
ncbi:MAG: hypothetical protein PHQ23_16540, partial [Candidatus Wallbacteria bacterium]|nr:hypothetical protein [Candidatus Wallbacteria bacterium]